MRVRIAKEEVGCDGIDHDQAPSTLLARRKFQLSAHSKVVSVPPTTSGLPNPYFSVVYCVPRPHK